ncbi:2-polyprenyl-6-methoxyphenol hydroxylase-like FAD-dependent oxidoreductase [Kitasatospora gansuensis]|uniref:2-polyprenyl-6-methoxyphenol hydroxylase-like FAD-dependent oxidoreductase n=1 Tax=Kitasatospora gansuensis TaxID=258050 RepID=A0A7W7S5W7_9ACTN|nr:2-polyprenyl-6-methoxyphenol hydroxylase-like FAD-dependent oxidoreductase [Kitasatospora gansuensis]
MTGTAVVVGAGVGGLATAIGLRRAGWRVTVRERRTEVECYGTAFALHPGAQDALERLGVGEAVRARAVPYRSAQVRTPGGRVLAQLPLERLERKAGRPELLISRPYLIDALLARLDALGEVTVRLGENVTDPAALADGYDLVVGADGINSAVREAWFGSGSGPRKVGSVAWIGIADLDSAVHGETWGRGRFFGLTPIEAGRTNWYAAVPEGTDAAGLRALFEGWHDPSPASWSAATPRRGCVTRCATSSPPCPPSSHAGQAGKVALVGDAAHAMTPNLGQGACTALLDAEALTRAVTHHGRLALPAALRAYDRERRRTAQRTALASRTLHRNRLHRTHLAPRHRGPPPAGLTRPGGPDSSSSTAAHRPGRSAPARKSSPEGRLRSGQSALPGQGFCPGWTYSIFQGDTGGGWTMAAVAHRAGCGP